MKPPPEKFAQKRVRDRYALLRTGMFVAHAILFVLLTVLWIYEWGYTRATATLSEIMAHDDIVRDLFYAWLSIYLVFSIAVGAFLLSDNIAVLGHHRRAGHEEPEKSSSFRIVQWCTIWYVALDFTKVVLLFFVTAFNVVDFKTTHYLLAGAAFVLAVIGVLLMVVRRGCSKNPLYVHRWRAGGCSSPTWVLWLNILWLLAVVAVAISFAVLVEGPIEFALSTCILLDRFWQLLDVHAYFDKGSESIKDITEHSREGIAGIPDWHSLHHLII